MIGDKGPRPFPDLEVTLCKQLRERLFYSRSRNPKSGCENPRGRHTGSARIKTAALKFFSYLPIQLLVKRLRRRMIQPHHFERHNQAPPPPLRDRCDCVPGDRTVPFHDATFAFAECFLKVRSEVAQAQADMWTS